MSESSSRESGETDRWWGDFRVPHDSVGCWRIGPMSLWIQRLRGEWRIATDKALDQPDDTGSRRDPELAATGVFHPLDYRTEVELPAGDVDLLALDSIQRFGLSGEGETIRIIPQLADRPVVTTPQKPFYIPPSERATVYVSSPLWLRIESLRVDPEATASKTGGSQRRSAGDSAPVTLLCEVPVVRPTDTWFGPTPYHGELCYASSAFCRLRLEDVAPWPFRAVTTATIINATELPFLLERMKLPVEYLPLFVDRERRFWTRDIEFTYSADEDQALLRHSAGSPSQASDPEQVSPPRQHQSDNLVTRAFSSLFLG